MFKNMSLVYSRNNIGQRPEPREFPDVITVLFKCHKRKMSYPNLDCYELSRAGGALLSST